MLACSHRAACTSMLSRSSVAVKALDNRRAASLNASPGMHSCWRLCLPLAAAAAAPATPQLRSLCSLRSGSMRAFSTKQQKGAQAPSAGISRGAASGSTPNDAVQQLDMLSKLLDTHYSVPGTGLKLGLETVVGKVPLAGGLAYGAIGVYSLALAFQYQAPPWLIGRMAGNVVTGTALRSIPFLGYFSTPLSGASSKNLKLLREHILKNPRAGDRAATGAPVSPAAPEPAGSSTGSETSSPGTGLALPSITLPPINWKTVVLLVAGVVIIPLSVGLSVSLFAAWWLFKTVGWVLHH